MVRILKNKNKIKNKKLEIINEFSQILVSQFNKKMDKDLV